MHERRGCAACGDIGRSGFSAIGERYYCATCYCELLHGAVPRPAAGVGNTHPSTPRSERVYDGGYGSETLGRFRDA